MRGLVKRQALAAVDPVDQPDLRQAAETQLIVCSQPQAFQAYVLKESLDRLWSYRYEGAMFNYLQRWIEQLRWQRLVASNGRLPSQVNCFIKVSYLQPIRSK
jgi:hypothetical protein